MTNWRNWAGNQIAKNLTRSGSIRSIDDVVEVVKRAKAASKTVKVVGSGHSFSGIARPEEVIVSFEHLTGIVSVDRENSTVVVRAGTTIADLNVELHHLGYAMPNLGDVTYQSILGALSTSTHGTGLRFGGLATQVVAFTMVTGEGEVITCTPKSHSDIWRYGRVSLGALGIIVEVTLNVVESFLLHAVEQPEPVRDVITNWDGYTKDNDHFEFYWIPHTRWALTKRNNRTTRDRTDRRPVATFWNKMVMENLAFGTVCRVGRAVPPLVPKFAAALPSQGRQERVDDSFRIFASKRLVKFYEMEYSVPYAALPEVLDRVIKMVDERGFRVSFPVEVRAVRADDIPLSTATNRDSAYIAVHMYKGTDYEPYFRAVEAIMMEYQGRPHWGKIHFQDRKYLAGVYPELTKFGELRDRIDPRGMFANAYLNRVLGRQSGISD
ncbi:MAG: D-arabinono-1,4-lactone oxidase [Ilumatobacteraceae bacterium]